jgi:hypothetical protein
MVKLIDRTGQKFNLLTFAEYKGKGKWLIECDCGNKNIVSHSSPIARGDIKSCGCLQSKTLKRNKAEQVSITKKEFVGKKFGLLTAISFSHNTLCKKQCWLFKCECGNKKVITKASVTRGLTISCGCLPKGNDPHKSKNDPEYKIWIKISKDKTSEDSWLFSYKNFINDIGKKPAKDYGLMRIDTKKSFTKDNVKWMTPKEHYKYRLYPTPKTIKNK